jgi:ectoine hydroxylase-related dioxygenase (phytanoyl-CoA dioxygenase family)
MKQATPDRSTPPAQGNSALPPKTLMVGKSEFEFPSPDLGLLQPSNDQLQTIHQGGDAAQIAGAELRERLKRTGYLFFRGALPVALVERCRRRAVAAVTESIERDNLHPTAGHVMLASTQWHHDAAVAECVEAPELFTIFQALFGEPAVTFDYKWMRGMPPGGHSAFHMDNIYMGQGTQDLVTAWLPLSNVTWVTGGLCVLEGSSSLEGFEHMRQTYGQWDTQTGDAHSRLMGRNDIRTRNGAPHPGPISSSAEELLRYDRRARWLTSDYRQGDVLLFTMHTLHGSVTNTTGQQTIDSTMDIPRDFRCSVDVRFQPASAPMDPRYCVEGMGPSALTRMTCHAAPSAVSSSWKARPQRMQSLIPEICMRLNATGVCCRLTIEPERYCIRA